MRTYHVLLFFLLKSIDCYSQSLQFNINEKIFNNIKYIFKQDSLTIDSIYIFIDNNKLKKEIQKAANNNLITKIDSYLVKDYFNFRFSDHHIQIDNVIPISVSRESLKLKILGKIAASREKREIRFRGIHTSFIWKSDGNKDLIFIDTDLICILHNKVTNTFLNEVQIGVDIIVNNIVGRYNLNPFKPSFNQDLNKNIYSNILKFSEVFKDGNFDLFNHLLIGPIAIGIDGTDLLIKFNKL